MNSEKRLKKAYQELLEILDLNDITLYEGYIIWANLGKHLEQLEKALFGDAKLMKVMSDALLSTR